MHFRGELSEKRIKEIFSAPKSRENESDYIWYVMYGIGILLSFGLQTALDTGFYDNNSAGLSSLECKWNDLRRNLKPFLDASDDPAYHFTYLIYELFGLDSWESSEQSLKKCAFACKEGMHQNLVVSLVLPAYFLIPMMSLPASTGEFRNERRAMGGKDVAKPMRTFKLLLDKISYRAHNETKTLKDTKFPRSAVGKDHWVSYVVHEHRDSSDTYQRSNTADSLFQPLQSSASASSAGGQ